MDKDIETSPEKDQLIVKNTSPLPARSVFQSMLEDLLTVSP